MFILGTIIGSSILAWSELEAPSLPSCVPTQDLPTVTCKVKRLELQCVALALALAPKRRRVGSRAGRAGHGGKGMGQGQGSSGQVDSTRKGRQAKSQISKYHVLGVMSIAGWARGVDGWKQGQKFLSNKSIPFRVGFEDKKWVPRQPTRR